MEACGKQMAFYDNTKEMLKRSLLLLLASYIVRFFFHLKNWIWNDSLFVCVSSYLGKSCCSKIISEYNMRIKCCLSTVTAIKEKENHHSRKNICWLLKSVFTECSSERLLQSMNILNVCNRQFSRETILKLL